MSPVDAHAGGRVKKRPRLGVTRPTTALPFAASSLLAARRPPAAAVAAPHGRRARWACTKVRRTHGEFRAFRGGAAATVTPPAEPREEEDQAAEALPAGFADAYRQFRDMQERQFQAFLALVASRTQP